MKHLFSRQVVLLIILVLILLAKLGLRDSVLIWGQVDGLNKQASKNLPDIYEETL